MKNLDEINEKVTRILETLRLIDRQETLACNLPYGEQRHLEIGIALAKNLKELARNGLTMLLVEANLQVALEVAQRGYIIEKGIIKFRSTSAQLLEDREIQQRYLGVHV